MNMNKLAVLALGGNALLRGNQIGTIEERINGCFERSMNGKMLPPESKEMTALVAYLKWLLNFYINTWRIRI